jgi:hypothetical protein
MRFSLPLLFVFVPSVCLAQSPDAATQKKETLKWLFDLQCPTGGFYMNVADPAKSDEKPLPSLRATSAAVRAIKYLGGDVPHREKHAAFVLSCFDPKTGGFAEMKDKPDVTITSIGVMTAAELAIPKEKYAKAMDYLKENAKTFEEVRIGAAAVESWGVKDCPFKLDEWRKVADLDILPAAPLPKLSQKSMQNGEARNLGSYVALNLRLGLVPNMRYTSTPVPEALASGQRDDGGWSKQGETISDIESTYRVMRAFMLMKEKPKNIPALRKFIESHRNKDGGYGVKPGDKSSASGVYYSVIVSKWLDEMEK